MRHFKAMLRKVDNTFVKDYAPDAEQMAALAPGGESIVILARSDSSPRGLQSRRCNLCLVPT